jgi:hypothetical protein
MKSNRTGERAYALLSQWRKQGIPDFITAYEAFTLSKGLVGKQYGKAGCTNEMNLAEVAMKTIKRGGE